MIYFYTRVSTKEQNLARQLEEAKSYKNVDEVFCDKQSGKSYSRPEYERLKSIVCKGDEVIVKEMDRLGRNKEATKEEIKWFKENGITLRILELPTTLIDFNGQEWIADMINNMLIEVLTTIAEQEVKKIDRRRAEGIAAMPVVDGKKVYATFFEDGCTVDGSHPTDYGFFVMANAVGAELEKIFKD